MDSPKPVLPPELVDEILSMLFASLSHHSQVRATQSTIASLSLVNSYFHEQAKKELLRNFPLTTLRDQCAYFQKFLKKHKSKVRGLRFILTEMHPFEDPRHLSCEEAEEFFQAVLPDRTFKPLEIDVKPGWAEKRHGPHLGLVPILPGKTIASLKQLRSLRIMGVSISVVEASALVSLPSVVVPKSLENLEIDDMNKAYNKTVSGWEKLVSLNLTHGQNWSVPSSLSPNLQALHLNALSIRFNTFDTANTLATEPRLHYNLFTSLTHLHLDFTSFHDAAGAGRNSVGQLSLAFMEPFLESLPTPLETLRLSEPGNGVNDMLLVLGAELEKEEPFTALSNLRRLELNGTGSIKWIREYFREKAQALSGEDDSVSSVMQNLGLGAGDLVLEKGTVSWVRRYLWDKSESEIEVAWFEKGASFGEGR